MEKSTCFPHVGWELLCFGGHEQAGVGGERRRGARRTGALRPSTRILGAQSTHIGEQRKKLSGLGRN
jgi:hypothetical protein